MKALKNNAGAIIIVVIILALFFAYKTFFISDVETAVSSPLNQNVGQEVVTLYTTLQAVTLDQKLFSSPAFKNLEDFSITLEPQPIGRRNPFDLIGAQ